MAIAPDHHKKVERTGSSNPNNLSIEEFLALPETKPTSDYIDGQIFQKLMPQWWVCSSLLCLWLALWVTRSDCRHSGRAPTADPLSSHRLLHRR